VVKWDVLENGCWQWNHAIMPNGYGRIAWGTRADRHQAYAHRFVYEWMRGKIPVGLQLDHLCRNRACVNPQHLETVTSRENTLRGTSPAAVNARMTACKNGHEFSQHLGQRRCVTCQTTWARNRREVVALGG